MTKDTVRTKPLVVVQAYEDRYLNNYNRSSVTPKEEPVISKSNGVTENEPARRNIKSPSQPPPPPPPPMPSTTPLKNGMKTNTLNSKPKAPPPPPLKKVHQNGNHVNGVKDIIPKPPLTPTPDYDTSSLVRVTNGNKPPKVIAVEMESLDSPKSTDPMSPSVKPPSTYFMKQQNGTLTMKKAAQPISVTIGEYPTNTFRKQPSKLDFLNGSVDVVDNGYSKTNQPPSSCLQTELSQMLSRSNLKKKTESDNLLGNGVETNLSMFEYHNNDSNTEPNANFNKRYGHVVLPKPPPISIPKVPVAKSLSLGPKDAHGGNLSHPNAKQELIKTESLPQNGILRSSAPYCVNERNSPLKLGMQHKTIKFGQTTTMIAESDITLVVNN